MAEIPILTLLTRTLVDRFAPASALIDAEHRVHYLRGPTSDYLQPASGQPSHNLLLMVREGLYGPLRAAVHKAVAESREVTTRAGVQRDGRVHLVRLIVTPLKVGGGANRLLVSFMDQQPPAAVPPGQAEAAGESRLRSELDAVREDLRLSIERVEAVNEELQAANEELQAANEEICSINEELQRWNEELETSKEELNTVNNQLQTRVAELEQGTNDLNNLLNSTEVATLFLDRTLRIRWFTPALKALFELLPTDIGRPISHFAPRFSGGELAEDARTVLTTLSPIDAEVVSHRNRWYLRRMLPYRTEDDRIGGVVVSFTDITARKQAEAALFNEKERAQITLHCIGDAVITTDRQGMIDYLNPIAEALTGCTLRQALHQPIEAIFRMSNEHTGEPAEIPVSQCLNQGRTVKTSNNLVLISQNGNGYAIQASAAPIRDKAGSIVGAVLVFQDVTEARSLAREAAHYASHDPLTGLLNRRELESRLDKSFVSATTQGARHALCYIDLDGFKLINDTAGHTAGDQLLKQIASLLARNCRSRDTLARIGGDEFCLLMEHCSLRQAKDVCVKTIMAIRNHPFLYDDRIFHVGASIGLASIDHESVDVRQHLTDADLACYVAKQRGGNRVHVFHKVNPDSSEHLVPLVQIRDVHKALDENNLSLCYQPIEAVRSNRRTAMYEVLLRLRDQHGELISPHAFVPIAERYGMMPPIDRWVLRAAIREGADLIKRDPNTMLAVNLSGQSINDEAFPDFVTSNLAEATFPANRLCFEITETAAIHNFSQAADLINPLRRLGCRFALDDFGKGVSSLAYLRNLSVDYLKIDGSFISNIVHSQTDRAMVSAVNELAHALGIETIGECAETAEVVQELAMLGVDYVQGFAVGEPRPIEMLVPDFVAKVPPNR